MDHRMWIIGDPLGARTFIAQLKIFVRSSGDWICCGLREREKNQSALHLFRGEGRPTSGGEAFFLGSATGEKIQFIREEEGRFPVQLARCSLREEGFYFVEETSLPLKYLAERRFTN